MLLKKLTEASGVSGNEKEVREIIIDEIKNFVDEIIIDKIGNVIVFKRGKYSCPKLMFTAHMDEVGLIVTGIDESGLIKFAPVGGIDKRILISKPVKVGENKMAGVIGSKPIHLQDKNEWEKALDYKQLYIDIGTKNKEETERLISIGDYISFDSDYIEFGNNLIKAKALDNRVGCSLLVELLKMKTDLSFYAAFTVMEEVGLIGAGPAAFRIKPEIAIILEGTLCSDVPNVEDHLTATKLGEGPAISLMDRTTYFNKMLRKYIIDVAETNNIPYQFRRTTLGGNDSGKIHLTEEGIITATISVPCRYIHSPISIINKNDYDNTKKLLILLTEKLKEGGFF